MGAIASQITSLAIVYLTVSSDTDQSKHQSSASLAFVWGIHRRPVNSPHKWPVARKMFPFDDVIMRNDDDKDGVTYVLAIGTSRDNMNIQRERYEVCHYQCIELIKWHFKFSIPFFFLFQYNHLKWAESLFVTPKYVIDTIYHIAAIWPMIFVALIEKKKEFMINIYRCVSL